MSSASRDEHGTKYKFRAEALPDILAFLNIGVEIISLWNEAGARPGLYALHITNNPEWLEWTCEMEVSGLELDDLIEWMKRVEDGHVMWQTIARAEDYTGERIR